MTSTALSWLLANAFVSLYILPICTGPSPALCYRTDYRRVVSTAARTFQRTPSVP